jgi:subtilisin family serine protease
MSSGNYTATFNGTSSACPNAAGVMALILSVNPALTMASARQIIESTCDKVGGYTYTAAMLAVNQMALGVMI